MIFGGGFSEQFFFKYRTINFVFRQNNFFARRKKHFLVYTIQFSFTNIANCFNGIKFLFFLILASNYI